MESSAETKIDSFDSQAYIDTVRQAYQEGAIHYTGRRNEEQQAVVDLLGYESDEFINGAVNIALLNTPPNTADVDNHIGKHAGEEYQEKFTEMREAFRQLYVAVGIASLRMERDGVQTLDGRSVPSLIELPEENRTAVLQGLFSDFQDLNALRFGAKGSGLIRRVFSGEYDDEGDEKYYELDRDTLTAARLWQGMQVVKYRENTKENDSNIPAVHVAGKMSPDEYRQLCREFRDIDKKNFDHITGFNQNARDALRKRHSK